MKIKLKKYFITSASTQGASLREREGNTLTTSRESPACLREWRTQFCVQLKLFGILPYLSATEWTT